MMKLLSVALTLLILGLTGCNAATGLEKDLGKFGRKLEQGASKTGSWLERQGNKIK